MKKLFVLFCAFAVSAGIAFAQPASPPSGWTIRSGSTRALYPAMLKTYTFAALPTGATNDLVLCTDCTADDDCSSGGGTKVKILVKTATGWVIIGDGSAAGAGDVGSIGDCTSGACLDGTSDGGTYVRLYDGNSHYTAIVSSDVTGNVTITLPAATGTLLTTTLASGYAWVGSVGNLAAAVDTAGWDKDSSNDYTVGGTDVAIADGGTGASLTDPAAHRLWGWDNTTNAIEWFVIGTGLTYTQATKTLSSTGAGDVTAASNLTTLALVQGDDGAKGVKTSAVTLDANSNIKIGAGAQATQTITGDVSGTDTVLTFGNGIINASTGALQYGGNTVLTTATSDLTPANFGATQTYSDGDLIDLSPIVISSTTIEGLILPTWGNFNPASKIGHIAWDTTSKSLKVYDGGWIGFAAVAAPVDASYLTYGSGDNATLTADVVLAEGLAIDLTASGTPGTNGLLTIAFDPTELTGNRTWAAGGAASVTWTFDNSGSVDPTFTAGDGLFTFNQAVTVTGTLTANGGIVMGTGDGFTVNGVNLLSGDELDGTKIKDADYGDVTVSAAGAWAVKDDSHAHGSTTITLASTNLSDTATLGYLAGANTWTGNNVFGNGDTDTLTIRSMIIGGNSRAVQIAAAVASPTYATGTNELYVAGDIETPGTVYAASFNTGTGTEGQRGITLTSNNALTPTANQIYVIQDVLYFSQAGAQKTPMRLEDAQTATGKKTFQGDIAVGDTSNAGSIDIWDGSANTWTIQTGSQAGDYILVLPTTAGTTGQYLKTTTSSTTATLSWDTPSATAHGSDTFVQFNDGGTALGSDAGFTYGKTTGKLTLGKNTVGGSIVIYNELGGTDYYAQLIPNAAQASGTVGSPMQITLPSYATTLLGSGTNTFTGIQAITVSNSNANMDALTVSGTITGNGSDIYKGITVAPTISTMSSTGNVVMGVSVENITDSTDTSTGVYVGTGWDKGINTASPLYVGDGTNGTTIGATGNVSFAGTATFDTTSATSSIPMTVSASTGAQTAAGQMHFESDTYILSIGDGDATPISLDFAKDAVYTFPAATSTLARTDAGQTFTGVQAFTSPTITTGIASATAGGATLGTAALPFSDIYFAGTSGTPATNHFKITGASSTGEVVLTVPATTATLARTDAGQTFTGVQTMTSPALTTPAITTSITTADTTFTALAGATTLLNLGGTGASASTLFPSTLDATTSITGAVRTSGGISAAKNMFIGEDLTVIGADITLLSATAGAKITGGDRTVTLAGTSANAENLIVTLGSNDNIVTVSSGTGATQLGFSALNLVTTGTIQGGIVINSDANGMSAAEMTAVGMYGTLFIATGGGTWILPTAAAGMSACLMSSGAAADLILDTTAGDTLRLKGTEGGDGKGATNAAAKAAGDFICVVATAANKWSSMGMSGAWVIQP